jgi:hypothetical protein
VRLGQFRQRGWPGPHTLKVHAVRADGRPNCGRWVETYRGHKMDFHVWNGDPKDVTCLSRACRG